MTNNDTNDPLPEDENLGSAGSPHSTGRNLHQRSGHFERAEQGIPPAHCEVCGETIPPTHNRCPDHQRDDDTDRSTGDYTWSISNIGIVVVAASSKFAALANASVALRRRNGGEGSDDSYDLIYDFGKPSDTLMSGWGDELPDAAELDSSRGEELYERAVSKTDWEAQDTSVIGGLEVDPSILGESPDSKAFLFTERGKAITNESQLAVLEEGPDNPNHDHWVIPAVLYNRDRNTAGESIRAQNCVNCGVSRHVFDGLADGSTIADGDEAGVWVCLECDTKKAGSPPRGYESREAVNRAAPTVGDEKPIDKAEEGQFESVMERLDTNGELEDASESS